jgi:hypothetical protein
MGSIAFGGLTMVAAAALAARLRSDSFRGSGCQAIVPEAVASNCARPTGFLMGRLTRVSQKIPPLLGELANVAEH